MLEILDDSQISFYDDSSYISAIKSLAHSYLSLNPSAQIIKSEGKYHLIKLDEESSLFVTALKVLSYLTVILPVVAYALDHTLSGTERLYVYDNPYTQDSVFCAAVSRGDFESMKVLYTFNPKIVNERDGQYGCTPLIAAAAIGNLKAIDFLLERKANLHGKSYDGITPFLMACGQGKVEAAKHLHEASKGAVLKDRDNSGMTPFLSACYSRNLELVKWFLSMQGTGVLQDKDKFEATPFLVACADNNLELAKILYETDPSILSDKNSGTETAFSKALGKALIWEDLSMAEWLLDVSKGEVLSERDTFGNTPFMDICLAGNFPIAGWLIEKTKGEVLSDRNDKGKTIFLIACEEGLINIAKKLYETKGPSILQDKDQDGRTAFDVVKRSNFSDMKAWLSEICPETPIEHKISKDLAYFNHIPKKVLDFCLIHRLFQPATARVLTNGALIDTVCQKTNSKGATLWIGVDKSISNGSPEGSAVYVHYFPSPEDRELQNLVTMSFIFQNRQLLEVQLRDKNNQEADMYFFDWKKVKIMMRVLEETILPEFVSEVKKA